MLKYYRLLSSPKILFLDDILIELEKEPYEQGEDYIASKVCFKDTKSDKIFRSFRITKPFIPEGEELNYFRIASLYLERENLITVLRYNPFSPKYIINYEGIVLVKSGGLGRKLVLEKLSGVLQRLAWFIVFLTFLVNTLIQLGYISKSTPATEQNIPSLPVNKNIIKLEKEIPKSVQPKSNDKQAEKD